MGTNEIVKKEKMVNIVGEIKKDILNILELSEVKSKRRLLFRKVPFYRYRKNERGERLIEFCKKNRFVAINTFFQQP